MAPKLKQSTVPSKRKSVSAIYVVSVFAVASSIFIGYRYTNSSFKPKEYSLPIPPSLTGLLSKNDRLNDVERLLHGDVNGPESLFVEGNTIYASTLDGRVLKIVNGKIDREVKFTEHAKCGTYETEPHCGCPLGIRRLNGSHFVISDAYLGLFTVDFTSGKFENILSNTDRQFRGVTPKFFNDLDVKDSTIYFSDSSSQWGRRDFLLPLLEQCGDGQIFKFNLHTGHLETLISGLNFPNGVQLHPDGNSLLISECGRARILRYYIDGPKKGHMETFINNLPGFPDNLRLSVDHSLLYVALAGVRHNGKPSFLDVLGPYPSIRKIIFELIPNKWLSKIFQLIKAPHGIFIIANASTGEILDSLHGDYDMSQISDDEEFYYLGSFHANFIAKVQKKSAP